MCRREGVREQGGGGGGGGGGGNMLRRGESSWLCMKFSACLLCRLRNFDALR